MAAQTPEQNVALGRRAGGVDIEYTTNSVVCTGLWMALPIILSDSVFIFLFYFDCDNIFHSSRKIANINSILLNSFYEASITLIPKQRHHRKRRPQTNISYEYGHRNPKQNTNKLNPATYIKNYTPWPSGIISGMQGGLTFKNQLT